MTPQQQKAKELVGKFQHENKDSYCLSLEEAKQCALIACDEVMKYLTSPNCKMTYKHWQSVKQEITKLT